MTIYRRLACFALALLVMPSVPCSGAAPSLQSFLRITDVAWESASPDGSRIAYTSEESGSWQVWVMNFDGSQRRQLTQGSDSVDFAQWVPEDPHTILYAKSRGGNGIDQFYYVRDDRRGSTALFPDQRTVTHVFGAFSRDGSKLAFSSNQRKAGAFDVYVLNRQTKQVRRVFEVPEAAYASGWSSDGTRLLVQRVATPYDDDLFIVDPRTAASRSITPHVGDATFDSAQFTPDARGVICVTNVHREFRTIARIDIANRTIRTVLDIPHDVDQALLSPNGKEMAYIVNRDGFGDVVVADATSGRTIGVPSMPPYIAETLTYAKHGSVLLYDASGPTFPKVVWAYDLKSRKTTRLLQPNFHGVPRSAIVEPRIVHVRSFDGTMVPAWYFEPKGNRGNLTVLLDIHGGPELQDRAWFYPFAQYVVSLGYALLDPNVRGSTGYGRTYLHMADGRLRENAVRDVAALRAWLVAKGRANSHQVFIDGASYGGYVVLSSMYHYPYAWAGGIDVFGVADWIDFLEKTSERRANREAVYGSLTKDRAFLAAISPINHASQIRRPLLIVAGANDTIVPVEQSKRLAAALHHAGIPVQLHIFPNEGHGISHTANLIALYRWMVAFVQRYRR